MSAAEDAPERLRRLSSRFRSMSFHSLAQARREREEAALGTRRAAPRQASTAGDAGAAGREGHASPHEVPLPPPPSADGVPPKAADAGDGRKDVPPPPPPPPPLRRRRTLSGAAVVVPAAPKREAPVLPRLVPDAPQPRPPAPPASPGLETPDIVIGPAEAAVVPGAADSASEYDSSSDSEDDGPPPPPPPRPQEDDEKERAGLLVVAPHARVPSGRGHRRTATAATKPSARFVDSDSESESDSDLEEEEDDDDGDAIDVDAFDDGASHLSLFSTTGTRTPSPRPGGSDADADNDSDATRARPASIGEHGTPEMGSRQPGERSSPSAASSVAPPPPPLDLDDGDDGGDESKRWGDDDSDSDGDGDDDGGPSARGRASESRLPAQHGKALARARSSIILRAPPSSAALAAAAASTTAGTAGGTAVAPVDEVVAWEEDRTREEYFAVRLPPILPMRPARPGITVRGGDLRSASAHMLRRTQSATEMRWSLRVIRKGPVLLKREAGGVLRMTGRRWGFYSRRFAVLSNFGLHVYQDETAYCHGADAILAVDYDTFLGVARNERLRSQRRASAAGARRGARPERGGALGVPPGARSRGAKKRRRPKRSFVVRQGARGARAKIRLASPEERDLWLREVAAVSLCATISGLGVVTPGCSPDADAAAAASTLSLSPLASPSSGAAAAAAEAAPSPSSQAARAAALAIAERAASHEGAGAEAALNGGVRGQW